MTRAADLAKAMLTANEEPNGRDIGQAVGGEQPEPAMEPFRPFPVDALPAPIA